MAGPREVNFTRAIASRMTGAVRTRSTAASAVSMTRLPDGYPAASHAPGSLPSRSSILVPSIVVLLAKRQRCRRPPDITDHRIDRETHRWPDGHGRRADD